MRIELNRMIAACLTNAPSGVNAQLAALARDGNDAAPANVTTVKNSADDNVQPREGEILAFPYLIVDTKAPIQMTGYSLSGVRDGVATVTVAYVVESGTAAKNFRDADYTLRAAVKAIHSQLWTGNGSDAARTRNSIAIKNSPSFTIGTTNQEQGSGVAIAALNIQFNVRDFTP